MQQITATPSLRKCRPVSVGVKFKASSIVIFTDVTNDSHSLSVYIRSIKIDLASLHVAVKKIEK